MPYTRESSALSAGSAGSGSSLSSSQAQMHLMQSAMTYLGSWDAEFRPGPFIATIMILVWSWTILAELMKAVRLTHTIVSLPLGENLYTPRDEWHLERTTGPRKVCFVLIQVVRIELATLLWVYGARWLGLTIDTGEVC